MKLLSQQYGKARVRVLKVSRQDGRHRLKEVDVSVMFEGAFAAAYTQADNGPVVPTDTMKNTVNALAREHLGEDIENFGPALGQHFLKRYGQVRQATIRLVEHCWEPMTVDGQPDRKSTRLNSSHGYILYA